MVAVISENFVVESDPRITLNSPRFLYENLAADAVPSADEEATGYPVELLQEGQTSPGERWKGTTTNTQRVIFDFSSATAIDAMGVAAHNLSGATIKPQYSDDGNSWTDADVDFSVPNNETILMLFAEETKQYWALYIEAPSNIPEVGVLYFGKSMGVQGRVYQGITPITLGRRANRIGQRSPSGHFLGIVVTAQWESFSAEFEQLNDQWYRNYFKPFTRSAVTNPFFFAWRPNRFPQEVGYGWLTDMPSPVNTGPGKLMSVSIDMRIFVDDD